MSIPARAKDHSKSQTCSDPTSEQPLRQEQTLGTLAVEQANIGESELAEIIDAKTPNLDRP
jgi:hypothetical protein